MLTFHHAPWSRSSSILWLLEELGVEYEIVHRDIRAPDGAPEDYRLIQPNKKVPAIEHDGRTVTERAAITIYLADIFKEAGLAPALDDPHRAAYLTWTVYCDSVFDPCIAMKGHGHDSYGSNDYSFGLFDDMVANLDRHLSRSDFAAGPRFTAADTQLASGIGYTMKLIGVLPERPSFNAYLERVADRPAYQRSQQMDKEMAMKTPYFASQAGS